MSFEETIPDIAAAITAFKALCPSMEHVILWGLCDAASAALLYWRVTHDRCVAGMVLLNPWIRSEQSLATTHVKHYYGQRLMQRAFWSKLIHGKVDIVGAIRELTGKVFAAFTRGATEEGERAFQDRMASALAAFPGPVLLILSGQDYTAKEFLEYAKSNVRWSGVISRENVDRADVPRADHTFSTAAWRQEVEALTLGWLGRAFHRT